MIRKRLYYVGQTVAWGMELLKPNSRWDRRLSAIQVKIASTKMFYPNRVF